MISQMIVITAESPLIGLLSDPDYSEQCTVDVPLRAASFSVELSITSPRRILISAQLKINVIQSFQSATVFTFLCFGKSGVSDIKVQRFRFKRIRRQKCNMTLCFFKFFKSRFSVVRF